MKNVGNFAESVYCTPNGKPYEILRSLDFNALYAFSMKKALPTGMPFFYRRNKMDTFDFEFAGSPHGWSKECLEWLSYMSVDPRFKKSDSEQYMMHSAVTGEYEIDINGKKYRVDGVVKTPGRMFLLEFFGCFYHRCSFCKIQSKEDTTITDQSKLTALQSVGKVIMIRSCQWKRLKAKWDKTSPYSQFFNQTNIKETEILKAVESERWFGILEVDIETPEKIRSKFREINFGTIFDKIQVTESMVSEEIREVLSNNGRKFPLKPQLTLVFDAKEYLVTSETLKLYIKLGMIVKKIHSCIEFQRSKPLDGFIKKSIYFLLIISLSELLVTEKRIEATKNGQKAMVNCYKLVGNSCYGRLGEI